MHRWTARPNNFYSSATPANVGNAGTDDSLLTALNELGGKVWGAIKHAWPEIFSRPLAVIPLGLASRLPLHTAIVNEALVCASVDVTVVPSATALHFASLPLRPDKSGGIFVAADPWYEPAAIPQTILEAQEVAEIYGCKPVLGVPGGLLAMGARAIVGPSWRVLDDQYTIALMKSPWAKRSGMRIEPGSHR